MNTSSVSCRSPFYPQISSANSYKWSNFTIIILSLQWYQNKKINKQAKTWHRKSWYLCRWTSHQWVNRKQSHQDHRRQCGLGLGSLEQGRLARVTFQGSLLTMKQRIWDSKSNCRATRRLIGSHEQGCWEQTKRGGWGSPFSLKPGSRL